MRNDGPYIKIDHPDNKLGAQAVSSTYNMDTGPLSMPTHIRIGAKGTNLGDGPYTIQSYSDQVDEYDIWLEEQVKTQNQEVMIALDDIYNKAIGNGVILTTRCVPQPYFTHAHVVKRLIEKLAS
jgi:hypothetical protein